MKLYRIWLAKANYAYEWGTGKSIKHEPYVGDPNDRKEWQFFKQDHTPACTPTTYYRREAAERAIKQIGSYSVQEWEVVEYDLTETQGNAST